MAAAETKREELGFEDAVLGSFEFLRSYGFKVTERGSTLVRYESGALFLIVCHDRISYEMNLAVGSLDDSFEKASLDEIVDIAGAAHEEGFGQHVIFQVSSREAIQNQVPKMASLLAKYGASFLKGDAEAFHRAARLQAQKWKAQISQWNIESVRRRLVPAWQKRNYLDVFALLSSLPKDALRKSELEKMAHAEKHLTEKDLLHLPIVKRQIASELHSYGTNNR